MKFILQNILLIACVILLSACNSLSSPENEQLTQTQKISIPLPLSILPVADENTDLKVKVSLNGGDEKLLSDVKVLNGVLTGSIQVKPRHTII